MKAHGLTSVGDAAKKFLQKRGLLFNQFNTENRQRKNRLQYGKRLKPNAKSL